MSKRSEHTFQFDANDIAVAAKWEAEYHESRIDHWSERAAVALETVKGTIGAKVTEHPVSSGPPQVQIVVDYGDPDAWREYQLAFAKIGTHREAAERYRTDERVYETQGVRTYELDADDVHHFRLGGQLREE
jgi:heme-degrading monooxygenase HmoA